MKLLEFQSLIEQMIAQGFGDHDVVFSLWGNTGRRDYLVHFPISNQIIGNNDVVYIGVADDCLAHRSMSGTKAIGEIYSPESESKSFVNVIINCIGTWFIFKENQDTDGNSYPGDQITTKYFKKGKDLVEYCNENKYHIVNRDCLVPELKVALKY